LFLAEHGFASKGTPLKTLFRAYVSEGHYHLQNQVCFPQRWTAIVQPPTVPGEIHDEHYGKTFDYTPAPASMLPRFAPRPRPRLDENRSQLWNGVEDFETRKTPGWLVSLKYPSVELSPSSAGGHPQFR